MGEIACLGCWVEDGRMSNLWPSYQVMLDKGLKTAQFPLEEKVTRVRQLSGLFSQGKILAVKLYAK